MSGVGGVGDADRSGGASGAGGVDGPDNEDGGVSEAEASSVAEDAVSASDATAEAVAETITAADATDTLEVSASRTEEETVTEAEANPESVAAVDPEATPVEEPGLLESAATWTGQTAKGYATGAINGVLDMANLVNSGVNGALDLAGVDYRFDTDMQIEPTSQAEKHAQDAITIASVAAGGVGLVKSAPAMAKGLDDLAGMVRPSTNRAPASAAATTPAITQAARVGDLSADEVAKIQAATDALGQDLYVVGSAAKGARRNVGSDLPLADFGGPKAGTRSDIDYAVRNGFDDAASELDLPDIDPSWGVRGVDYLNLDNSPAIRFSPGKPPEFLDGGGRLTFD